MDQPNSQSYHLARAEAARELSRRAGDPAIAAVHSEFATRYENMVVELEQNAGTEPVAQAV